MSRTWYLIARGEANWGEKTHENFKPSTAKPSTRKKAKTTVHKTLRGRLGMRKIQEDLGENRKGGARAGKKNFKISNLVEKKDSHFEGEKEDHCGKKENTGRQVGYDEDPALLDRRGGNAQGGSVREEEYHVPSDEVLHSRKTHT